MYPVLSRRRYTGRAAGFLRRSSVRSVSPVLAFSIFSLIISNHRSSNPTCEGRMQRGTVKVKADMQLTSSAKVRALLGEGAKCSKVQVKSSGRSKVGR